MVYFDVLLKSDLFGLFNWNDEGGQKVRAIWIAIGSERERKGEECSNISKYIATCTLTLDQKGCSMERAV